MTQSTEFEEFYQANYRRTVALVAAVTGDRTEAEDIAQETFSRALARWNSLGGYDLPEAWVRRVAMRLTVDSRRRMLRSLNLWGRLSAVRDPESTATDEIGSSDIGDALMRLPVGQRQVLVLHYFADLSVDAISQEHGIPVGTVKTRLAAGRRRLEQEMTSTKVVHDGR